jgi:hypothetical protein
MVAPSQTAFPDITTYPESDGRPMADNTQQFRWIVTIMGLKSIINMTRIIMN